MQIPDALKELHRSLGARFDSSSSQVLGYSELEKEYWALQETCGLYDRSARGKLRLSGSERVEYLHRMVTADVQGLGEGRGAYTAILNAQGSIVADARILRRADELFLDVEPGLEGPVAQYLDRFIISEDVEIEDVTARFALLSFVGPRASEAVSSALGTSVPALSEHEVRVVEQDDLLLVGTRLAAAPGVDLFAAPERAREIAEAALERFPELRAVGFEAVEVARVEAGVPRFGLELVETAQPLEAGLERAISFTKGCYVGQEAIARAAYRGATRRKLAGLSFEEGALPEPGFKLFGQRGAAKAAAEITSAVRSPRFGLIGLGLVRREHLAPGTELVAEDGRKARVRSLPFAQAS
ncbi:MAG TPA: glycine cleavage system protein T [Myxococcales bacterium]|nr:glycine cleavage system protein T [Myxococcales bacterium]